MTNYELIIKHWIKNEVYYKIWQDFTREELKILGIANLKQRTQNDNHYNKELFLKQNGEFRPRPRIVKHILQNFPLKKTEEDFAENLMNWRKG